jgi:hypothetical protein
MLTYEDLDVAIRGDRLGPVIPGVEVPVLVKQISLFPREHKRPHSGRVRFYAAV